MVEMNISNVSLSESNIGLDFDWKRIVIGVAQFSVVITTILGNLLVLIAIYREKRLQTKFNFYIVNLAMTDLLVAVTAMSFYTVDNILSYWPFGEFLCGVWIFCDYGMTFASVFTLLVISVDRFWSVTWRMHYRIHHTKRKCVIFIIALWVFMLILWLPPCILDRIHNSSPMSCKWDPANNRGFVVIVATIGHHGACFVLLFCYVKVFYMLRKRRQIKVAMGAATVSVDHSPSCSEPPTNLTGVSPITDASSSKKKGIWTSNIEMPKSSYLTPTDQRAEYSDYFKGECEQNSDHRNRRNDNQSVPNQPHSSRENREVKVFKTLTYIIVGYTICWVPFHIVFDISAIAPNAVPEIIYTITFWMTYLNSTINPFLYNFSSPEFKRVFKKILLRH